MADVDTEVAAGQHKKRTFKKFSFRGVDLDGLLGMSTEDLVKLFTDRARSRPITGPLDGESNSVTEKDREHLLNLLDGKGGEMAWRCMMERSTPNMTYQAWCHDPEIGPVVYRSKTVFEEATPELVKDFFWDEEFRPKWDSGHVYVNIPEECPDTGMMIVHRVKKFPFFCKDREYIIGRRIWEEGKTYYCVTKGVTHPALPRLSIPRRVDLYFSSCVIKPVQSGKGDGQLSACEVILIHYEEKGLPKEIAKLADRQSMWGTVKELHAGFRAYQNARKLGPSLSHCANMARITTKLTHNRGTYSAEQASGEEEQNVSVATQRQNDRGGIDWKWLAIGGTVALVCGLQIGLIGKSVVNRSRP